MKGRKPKPTSLKKLEGNLGKRPLPPSEALPSPSDAMPDRPPGLCPVGRQAWERLAAEMHRAKLLTPLDADALESYCRLYAHAKRCWREAAKDGAVVLIGGRPEVNPWIRQAHQAEKLLHQLRSELGLNATSRSRIAVDPSQSEDDLDNFVRIAQ